MCKKKNETFGFLRVAAATPRLKVADCLFNASETSELLTQTEREAVQIIVFPELGITGYTAADLFHQNILLDEALKGLEIVRKASSNYQGVALIGLPLRLDDMLFNCAVVLQRGSILGVVPKSCIPNYNEFYESRWFAPAVNQLQNPRFTSTKNMNDRILRVLIRVDLQNDFMPGGALAVPEGDQTIEPANRLAASGYYDLVVDSQDSHPANHGSFASQYSELEPFQATELNGLTQVLWPDHCVEFTHGWQFHPGLDQSKTNRVFRKGQNPKVDSYSAFYDNGHNASAELKTKYPFLGQSTGLAEYLSAEAERVGAQEIQVDVLGLALGYCGSYTALDAARETFQGKLYKVRLIEDASQAIVMHEGDYEKFKRELNEAGVKIILSDEVLAYSE